MFGLIIRTTIIGCVPNLFKPFFVVFVYKHFLAVYMYVCMYVCVCMCVCVCVCVYVDMYGCVQQVHVEQREKETLSTCARACVQARVCLFRACVQIVQQGEAHEMKQAPFAVKGKGG